MTIQRGSAIAATWLIGLGIVLLVRQAAGLDWGEAWPMLLILVGVAGVVTQALERSRSGERGVVRLWSFTWPVAWIIVGSTLLASTTGSLGRGPIDLMAELWPWILVVVGVWFLIGAVLPVGGAPIETAAVPLDRSASGSVRGRSG